MKIIKVSNLETSILGIRLVRLLLLLGALLLFKLNLIFPAILSLLLLLVSLLSKWWSETGLKKLTAGYDLIPKRVFAGDNTTLKVIIANKKLLPAIITWKIKLPGAIKVNNSTEEESNLSFSAILKWYETREVSFALAAVKRGYYSLDYPCLVSSDGIGLYHTQAEIDDKKELIVYPRILPLDDYGIKAHDLIGERIDKRYILPDPIMIMGLREYSADMPAYLINWKASAKQDVLMAKLIEPSSDYKICIAMDGASFWEAEEGEAIFERALSIAASIAVWADEQRIPVGLLINVSQTGMDGPIAVPVNSGTNHMLLLLEKLARAEYRPLGSWQDILQQSHQELPWGTTLVLIARDYVRIPNMVVIAARP